MANVKTDISLSKSLLEEVETVAREMKISRSRLFVMAIKDFIRRYQNRQLLEKINQTYQDGLDEEDRALLRHSRRVQRELMESEW